MFERLALAAIAALVLTPFALIAVAPLAYVAATVTGNPAAIDPAAMNVAAAALAFVASFTGLKGVLA